FQRQIHLQPVWWHCAGVHVPFPLASCLYSSQASFPSVWRWCPDSSCRCLLPLSHTHRAWCRHELLRIIFNTFDRPFWKFSILDQPLEPIVCPVGCQIVRAPSPSSLAFYYVSPGEGTGLIAGLLLSP